MKFIFDLDGTITVQEILPLIVRYFGVEEDLANITNEIIQGSVPFIEGFVRRVHMLGKLPVAKVASLLEQVAFRSKIYEFIQAHKEESVVVTENLDCWVEKLLNRIGCQWYASEARVENDKVVSMVKVLNKEQVVKKYQDLGEKIIFIGCGNNDMEAMRIADIAITVGLMHHSVNSIVSFTDYLIFDEKAICRQLNQLF